jgi:hypothetical protein
LGQLLPPQILCLLLSLYIGLSLSFSLPSGLLSSFLLRPLLSCGLLLTLSVRLSLSLSPASRLLYSLLLRLNLSLLVGLLLALQILVALIELLGIVSVSIAWPTCAGK